MEKYNVPLSLIKYCVDNELLDTLHYYYKLRVAFKNRVIYEFSYKKASCLLQLSVGATHKQIKKMLKEGWVELQSNGSLKIKGVNKLKLNDKDIIRVPIEPTKKAQLLQFRYVLIHQNLKAQQKRIKIKTEIVEKVRFGKPSKKQYKRCCEVGGVDKFEKSILKRVTLSNKKFGNILGRSQATGKLYQKAMNKANLIESKAFYEVLGKVDDLFTKEGKNTTECYYLIIDNNGYVKKRRSNTILPLLKT